MKECVVDAYISSGGALWRRFRGIEQSILMRFPHYNVYWGLS